MTLIQMIDVARRSFPMQGSPQFCSDYDLLRFLWMYRKNLFNTSIDRLSFKSLLDRYPIVIDFISWSKIDTSENLEDIKKANALWNEVKRNVGNKVSGARKTKSKSTDFDKYEKLVKARADLRITNKPIVQIPFNILDKSWEDYIPLNPKTGTPITTVMLGKLTKRGEVINLSYLEKSKLMGDGDSNAKTKKNDRYTLILYLTPASKSGINFCEKASPGCIWSCLSQSGRGIFNNVQQARLLKSYVVQDFELFFLQQLQKQIISASKSTIRRKYKNKEEIAIRLNGTSDLPFLEMMQQNGLLNAIPSNVRFYDYTKYPNKAGVRRIGKFDYVVTYSRCEDYFDKITGKWVDNLNNALQNLEKGNTVAVVFAGDKLPRFWFGYQVIDGDERDDLMLDVPRVPGRGIVLGLKAKIPRGKEFQEWVAKSKNFIVECDTYDDCRSTGLITIGK